MTARTWKFGDPEPTDHPSVVDDNGHTWTWSADEGWSGYGWTRQVMTRHKAFATYGPVGQEWDEILDEDGTLREATADEARNVTMIFAKGHPDA